MKNLVYIVHPSNWLHIENKTFQCFLFTVKKMSENKKTELGESTHAIKKVSTDLHTVYQSGYVSPLIMENSVWKKLELGTGLYGCMYYEATVTNKQFYKSFNKDKLLSEENKLIEEQIKKLKNKELVETTN